ncbi:hypothetical protein B0H14DRAFT_3752600 [Mycena olivaceomarginata]|nr:hypothetical protein B0H14DRAFT_3752600 [Mycena olivaceomarginata]
MLGRSFATIMMGVLKKEMVTVTCDGVLPHRADRNTQRTNTKICHTPRSLPWPTTPSAIQRNGTLPETHSSSSEHQRAFPNGPYDFLFQHALKDPNAAPRGLEIRLDEYPDWVSNTCALQRDISQDALYLFAHDAFEVKWMKARAEVRGRHILGAMAAVCSKARNLNEARRHCPELSLRRLRLDGKVFLDLLNKPIYVPHPGWNAWAAAQSKLNDSEGKKITLAKTMILRTTLIPSRTKRAQVDPETENHAFLTVPPAELVALLGPEAANAKRKLEDEKSGMQARHDQRLVHCVYINCTKTEPPDDSVRFSRCKPCFEKMQRQHLYCSGACQKADWMLRHKVICGKALDFETVSRVVEHPLSASTSDMRTIGPPIGGYRRSLALTAQVTALNTNPTVNYQLYDAHNEPVNVDLGAGQYPQQFFRATIELAMTTGNEVCLGFIAHYLCVWSVAKDGLPYREITPKMIVAQLAREFEFDKLRETVLAAQQMQNQDPLRRPPLLADMPREVSASLNEDANVKKLCGIAVTLDYAEAALTVVGWCKL